jgi:Lrp/AsnC family leucine-responsive transcriptional regulator
MADPTASAAPTPVAPHRLDDIDHRILAELSHDGRLSNTDLARRIGLSPSACWTRVRALEQSGIIKGYTAIIDRAAIGFPETVVVEVTVDKQKHTGDVLEGFEAASSTADYEHFLREKLYRVPGVRQARSIFILREIARPLTL